MIFFLIKIYFDLIIEDRTLNICELHFFSLFVVEKNTIVHIYVLTHVQHGG